MIKTLEAIIRGYYQFRVITYDEWGYVEKVKHHWFYTPALNSRKSVLKSVAFEGKHITKGWTGFYYRTGPVDYRSPQ